MTNFQTRIVMQLIRILNLTEYICNYFFVFVRSKILATRENVDSLNSPNGWEKLYLSKIKPIDAINTEGVSKLISLTDVNETMLETGCGSGTLSAELSLSGRKVAVCDFSQPILNRVKLLFDISKLPVPETYLLDLTKHLPFSDGQFDVVWNSGVLEHWTDEELQPIVKELARCAKRCVISLVPNERSLLYRFGREAAEAHGICPWGREIPRSSLREIFEQADLINIMEMTIHLNDAPNLISFIDPVFYKKIKKWWNLIPDSDPVKENQGYLLLTIGYKRNI